MRSLLRHVAREFSDHDCPSLAAALAYYTLFALPSVLVLVTLLAGAVYERQAVQGQIRASVEDLIGPEAAVQVEGMIELAGARLSTAEGIWAVVLGLGGLLFGATGAFLQLQKALNSAWGVAPDAKRGGFRALVVKRLLSFGMVACIAGLLLVSVAASTAVAGLGRWLTPLLPGGVSTLLLQGVDLAVSFAVITVLFAAVFKVLPDVRLRWSEVGAGAVLTAFLFVVGKGLIGLYLGRSNPGEAFGAAGALGMLLAWIYLSAMVFLLGAEFTQVWARRRGTRVVPSEGAVRVVEEKKELPGPEPA